MAAAGLTQLAPGDERKVCDPEVTALGYYLQVAHRMTDILRKGIWICKSRLAKPSSGPLLKCKQTLTEYCDLWLPLQKCDMSYSHVRSMVEFAIALMAKLENINTHSFNSFKLRIGESLQKNNADVTDYL